MSLEQKFVALVTAAVRRKREADQPGTVSPARDLPPAKLREARFSDFEGVARLKHRGGIAEDSIENWYRLWRDNPALQGLSEPRPIGWVLEADEKIVGFIGNIALRYRYAGRTLDAVASHGLVIDPGYRNLGVSLVSRFYRQKSVDLFVVTTAIPSVAKLSEAFKSVPLPQPDFDSVLFWLVRPRGFAASIAKRLGLQGTAAAILRATGTVAFAADTTLRRRHPRNRFPDFAIVNLPVADVGEEFDRFMAEWTNSKNVIAAERSSDTIKWHFRVPGDAGTVSVLACFHGRDLLGYAVVRHEPYDDELGITRSIVADVLVRDDNPDLIEGLLFAAWREAKQRGSDVIEVQGLPKHIRTLLEQWRPYQRRFPACPYWYKAVDPNLYQALANPDIWYATAFDGDGTLIRPSRPSAVSLSDAIPERSSEPAPAAPSIA